MASNTSPGAEAAAGAHRSGLADIVDEVRAIPGVVGTVLHTVDGAAAGAEPLTPADEQATGLTRFGKKLGDLLNAGPLVVAIVHGSRRNLLLLSSKETQLTILIEAGSRADAAQAQIRKLLGPQP